MQNDVIKPAVYGTLNVLRTCTKAKTVKRVVVTSSASAASISVLQEQKQDIDETVWTDVDFHMTKKTPALVDWQLPHDRYFNLHHYPPVS